MRTIYIISVFLLILGGCKLESFNFQPPDSANDPLFSGLEQQAKSRKMMSESSSLTSEIDVYRVQYREEQVEETNVLVWRMVSENDPRFDANMSDFRSGQDLFIVRLYASNPKDDLFIYYSMSVGNGKGCTGVGNAYMGKLGEINGAPHIFFYERLNFRHRKEMNGLEVDSKSGRRKIAEHLLRFKLAERPERMADSINPVKITLVETNKIGGLNPMLFDVGEVLGSNAMRMKKIN
ncbi:MAG: hypothetical protein V1775_10050 [Bacteroidota bacterium]